MTLWERLTQQYEIDRRFLAELGKKADDARCPFELVREGGNPLGVWDEFRCIRDRHDDVDHELAAVAWREKAR